MEVWDPTATEGFVERLDRATAAISAASAEVLRSVAEGDTRGFWRRDGATSMTSWLAARYGLAWGTAREWVRVAHVLEVLPRIAQAYASGRVSWDQLRPLTRFATAETDAEWAERAPALRPWALYQEARRHERIRRDDARDLHRRRYLSLWWDRDLPVLYLEGMLPAEQGAALEAALERRAEEVVLEEPPESPPHQARLADALVELVTESATAQPSTTTLVIHAGAEMLGRGEPEAGPWLAETEGGHRLAAATVRRLACDARIEWVLESEGRPVGIGRRGRQVPEQVHRVLRHRDGAMCRFPGCERKRWLHAHHLVHWADGGATNLDNLVLLCHAHHRLIHDGGWRTSGHPGRDLRFHDPGGSPVRNGPLPPRAPIRARL